MDSKRVLRRSAALELVALALLCVAARAQPPGPPPGSRFATGTEDFLMPVTEATVAMLEQHGFDVDFHKSGGGHTWINWREYLHEFAPLLFK